MIRRIFKENKFYLLLAAIIGVFFSSWTIAPLVLSTEASFGAVKATSDSFQNIYSWLPIVRGVTDGNFLPVLPSLYPEGKGVTFYPYLSIWFYAGLITLFGYTGVVIVGQWVLPIASFVLATKIFKRNLSALWSVSLVCLGFFSFPDWPFREFLLSIFKGGSWQALGVYQSPEIISFPFPSLSSFYFLLVFYISTRPVRLTTRKLIILSTFWALLSQIHLADALFGEIFWLSYSSIRLFRQRESISKVIIFAMLQIFLFFILAFPAIYSLPLAGFNSVTGQTVSLYYLISYFVMPLFLMGLLYFIQRIDAYEVFVKFWHIYVLLSVEMLFILCANYSSLNIDLFALQNRIVLLFLHIYYYVPVVYYACRSNINYHNGVESKPISSKVRLFFNLIFSKYSKFWLPCCVWMLTVFLLTSGYKSAIFQKEIVGPSLTEAKKEFNKIQQYYSKGETVVSDTPAVNMLATIAPHTYYGSLWINRFANQLSTEEAIERLTLYARIYNWPVDKFISFMLPGKLQKSRSEIVSITPEEVVYSGVGYWLIFHKKKLYSWNKAPYVELLKKSYLELDVVKSVAKFDIHKIYAHGTIAPELNIYRKTQVGDGYLYKLGKE